MLSKGVKGVNNADRQTEDGPADARDLSASSLPLNIDRPERMPYSSLKSLCTKNLGWYLSLPPTREDMTQGQMTRRLDYSGD